MKKYKFLYGKKYLNLTKKKIKKEIKYFKKKKYRKPNINIINIGKNKSSIIYINQKCKYFKYTNIKYKIYNYNKYINEKIIIKKIKQINKNKNIDCLLIQLPLPKKINTNKIINHINYNKDVDGIHPYNIGKLCQGNPYIRSCTSYGVIKLLKINNIKLKGLNALIIGSSNLVGKPMSMELFNHGCTITIVNKKTKNINNYINNSDLLVSAIGKYNKYSIKNIKKNCIIIDIGFNIKNNKIKGDIKLNNKIIKKIKYITPIPGGVGPMTISILLKNIIKIYKKNINWNIN